MSEVAAEVRLTVDELAARAGVTVRTVRFYGTKGLLPPPELGPRRVGLYGAAHLDRLGLIEELQRQGLTLAAIERYLANLPQDSTPMDLAIHRALVASWTPEAPEAVSRAQLERRVGRALSEEQLDRLAAMGALERTADPEAFRVDPGLLPLGARILDVPIPLETLLAARAVLLEHSRATAHELHRLFRETVWKPYRESEPEPAELARMKDLAGHIQPMVAQALVTAFQRSLREELGEAARGTDSPSTEED
ncbi:MerR family transcriptional regulator [Kitasatospora sp. CM 4170]|uniref:MerR family transcriptional regulator n=1 Tax=Kitasatospora aburaviensis TaxID=67265 RepID=A0ABW1EV14_9ACTN|nr:MerR family transcriptional regulator [Kitasatospora sp. CM 4170]WNM45122.1 MerR family transcriptional regulator [Kitasatospora sp. CM 4170]